MLLLQIAEAIGGWPTFWLVVITGVAGGYFTRMEGIRSLSRIHYQLQANRIPTEDIVGACLIFGAGLLLLTPGVLTDILGFCMLLPILRKKTARLRLGYFKKRFKFTAFSAETKGYQKYSEYRNHNKDDSVIDVEAVEVEDED